MKSQLFENRFEQDLLKELPYGRILIIDNAAFFTEPCEKILANLDLFAAVFARIQSH